MSQKETHDAATVPGPQPHTTLMNAVFGGGSDGLRSMQRLQQEFGDIVHIRLGPKSIYMLFHPDDAQHVLQTNNRNYIKGELIENLQAAGGEGLFTSEGGYWFRQRRMMQPFFHRRVIAGFAEIMTTEISHLLERWQTLSEVYLNKEMMRLTLSVVAKALFTTAMSEEALETVHQTLGPILRENAKRTKRPFSFLEKLPLPANRAYTRNRAKLNAIVQEIIETRRNDPGEYEDLLQMLIDAADEETGERMTDKQVRDEVITLFVAGHETTATALTWAFELLSESPVVRRQLQAEVDTVLGYRAPTADDYANLPFTLAVFEEALRLYPPVTMIPRQMLEVDTLGGYELPAGSNVVVNTFTLHRHPAFWSNPEAFDPTRFLSDNSKGRHRFAYLPFSAGPRYCIGDSFAKMEAVLALAMITQKFELDLVGGQSIGMANQGTLRPNPDVLMRLVSRQGEQ